MSVPGDCDVLIAGGGMVGVSLALALDTVAGGQLRIVVAEGFAVPAQPQASYHPSFDARATALAHGSRLILERLGVWAALAQHVTPITDIHVSERGHFGSTMLHATERGWAALGYVVENAWLGNTLLAELRRRRAVTVLSPAQVRACTPGAERATVRLEYGGSTHDMTARLVAVADGADSALRRGLGIGADTHAYGRDAIIANVCCTRPHAGHAFERFTDWGPMALLPLAPSAEGQPRMALVWTMAPERAEALLAADDSAYLAALQQRFGQRQGRFTRVGKRFRYPLQLVRAEEQVRRQIAVVGNAAHSLHPVAGQGFNLALRDVQRLADCAGTAANPGDPQVLADYLQRQALDQARTVLFSDRLTALFDQDRPLIGGLRRLGLTALDLNPSLKQLFVDHTAGYHGGAALGYAHPSSAGRPA